MGHVRPANPVADPQERYQRAPEHLLHDPDDQSSAALLGVHPGEPRDLHEGGVEPRRLLDA